MDETTWGLSGYESVFYFDTNSIWYQINTFSSHSNKQRVVFVTVVTLNSVKHSVSVFTAAFSFFRGNNPFENVRKSLEFSRHSEQASSLLQARKEAFLRRFHFASTVVFFTSAVGYSYTTTL